MWHVYQFCVNTIEIVDIKQTRYMAKAKANTDASPVRAYINTRALILDDLHQSRGRM